MARMPPNAMPYHHWPRYLILELLWAYLHGPSECAEAEELLKKLQIAAPDLTDLDPFSSIWTLGISAVGPLKWEGSTHIGVQWRSSVSLGFSLPQIPWRFSKSRDGIAQAARGCKCFIDE